MDDNQSLLDLEVNQEAATNITEASRWGKFMAVLILIAFGLVFLLFILLWGRITDQLFTVQESKTISTQAVAVILIIAFLIVGAVVAILLSFLIRGANRIRNGIRNRDQFLFNSGLANLKNYFIMYGVLAILGLLLSLGTLLNN